MNKINKTGGNIKRRLRSIKVRYPGLGFWWPAFVLILLLCLMIILKDPNIEKWATVGLLVVTLMYVILTKGIFDEMRRQRLNASQAVIWPEVWWTERYFLELTFNNIGNVPALKVKVFLQDELITSASHISQGDKVVYQWGQLHPPLGPLGERGDDTEFLKRIAALVGHYLLVVTWYDLLEQHFEARLLFRLQVDSEGKMSSKIIFEPKLRRLKKGALTVVHKVQAGHIEEVRIRPLSEWIEEERKNEQRESTEEE